MSLRLQAFLHGLQTGAGLRLFKVLFVLIVVGAVATLYDGLAYRNLASREAMDMAQVGRNLAEGRGYATLFIRPFSLHLLRNHQADQKSPVKEPHPDLANPPVYPCLLAGLFKLVPAKYFAVPGEGFTVHVPEVVVALFNQLLLVVAGWILFALAARFFDRTLAWVSAVVFVGSDVFWRYSVTGLNTMLLVVILLGAIWCLVVLEQWVRTGRSGLRPVLLAGLAGVLIGVGGLTRYAFAWLVVPVVVYLAFFFPQRRASLLLVVLAGFLAVMSPWVARNYSLCGLPFGTATYSVVETTHPFPEDRLQRSLHPELKRVALADLSRKFLKNSRETVQNDLPRLGGSWVSAFFLVGLLVPFRNPALSGLRGLLVLILVTFALVQPLARTSLSGESMLASPENLLVLLAPLVFMYGAALFFLLLDNAGPLFPPLRRTLVGGFCVMACLPLIQTLLPPRTGALAYPPYFPPRIQQLSGWFRESEMIMSDMPWAVAWYGGRPCVLSTLGWQDDFREISDHQKPIKGLYLTQLSTDSPFVSNYLRGENRGWGSFLVECVLRQEVPTGFPLRFAPQGFFPEQIFLADYERWRLKGQ